MESSLASWSKKSWGNSVPHVLSRNFFERDTLTVSQELLGKILVVRLHPAFELDDPRSRTAVGRIVETEAYHGTDPASHSARGKTPRSSIMFGEAGVVYIYFIYGMYEMLNFVTERKDYPGAALIRALEPLHGITQATNGPGRLTRAMGIKMSHNGESLQGPKFFVTDDGFKPTKIQSSPRVGISVAKENLWRYFLPNNPYVSKAKFQ